MSKGKEGLDVTERARVGCKTRAADKARVMRRFTLRKFASPADHARRKLSEPPQVIEGNAILNEGADEMLKLIGGLTATAFGSGAYMGVGDDNTAAAAAQTGLQASTNKLYKQVDAAPTVSAQTMTYVCTFADTEANFAWNELTIANGNSDAADNMNRLVQSWGTKANPAVWEMTFDLGITTS